MPKMWSPSARTSGVVTFSGLTASTTLVTSNGYDMWVLSFVLEVDTAGSGLVSLAGSTSGTSAYATDASTVKIISHQFKEGVFIPRGDDLKLVVATSGTFNIAVEYLQKISQNSPVT